jgi:hypothetical protein
VPILLIQLNLFRHPLIKIRVLLHLAKSWTLSLFYVLYLRSSARIPAPQYIFLAIACQQSIGLPCYYTLYERKLSTGVVHLKDIHTHWHYSRPEPGTLSTPALPVLNPLVVKGKGRPLGALGTGRVAPTSTRREPSSFELPSSSAPPALATTTTPTERLYIVNSGLSRLQNGHQDTYEPGTQGGRAYMRGLSSIWQTELVDVATAAIELIEKEVIEVDEDTIEVEIN